MTNSNTTTTFSNLQDTVQQIATRSQALEKAATTKRRDEIIATALSEGRLTAPETASWRAALDTSEETTVTLLAARTPVFSTVGNNSNAQALTAAEDAAFGIS